MPNKKHFRKKRKVASKFSIIVPEGGDESDRNEYAAFCWEKKIEGMSAPEIAREVKAHFNLEREPTRETIRNWLNLHGGTKTSKITSMREMFMRLTIDRAEAMVGQLMPLVLAEAASIRRRIGQNEIIDEDFIKEKLETVKTILKIEDHVRKVLGVGLAMKEGGEELGGKESVVNFILNVVQQNINNGLVGNAQLRGGNDVLDALDEPFATSFETKSKYHS